MKPIEDLHKIDRTGVDPSAWLFADTYPYRKHLPGHTLEVHYLEGRTERWQVSNVYQPEGFCLRMVTGTKGERVALHIWDLDTLMERGFCDTEDLTVEIID